MKNLRRILENAIHEGFHKGLDPSGAGSPAQAGKAPDRREHPSRPGVRLDEAYTTGS